MIKSELGQGKWDVPIEYTCPISLTIMSDPVITPEGDTFERKWIEKWINEKPVCPLTKKPLSKNDLKPNRALRLAISRYVSNLSTQEKQKLENLKVQNIQSQLKKNYSQLIDRMAIISQKRYEEQRNNNYIQQKSKLQTKINFLKQQYVQLKKPRQSATQVQKTKIEMNAYYIFKTIQETNKQIQRLQDKIKQIPLIEKFIELQNQNQKMTAAQKEQDIERTKLMQKRINQLTKELQQKEKTQIFLISIIKNKKQVQISLKQLLKIKDESQISIKQVIAKKEESEILLKRKLKRNQQIQRQLQQDCTQRNLSIQLENIYRTLQKDFEIKLQKQRWQQHLVNELLEHQSSAYKVLKSFEISYISKQSIAQKIVKVSKKWELQNNQSFIKTITFSDNEFKYQDSVYVQQLFQQIYKKDKQTLLLVFNQILNRKPNKQLAEKNENNLTQQEQQFFVILKEGLKGTLLSKYQQINIQTQGSIGSQVSMLIISAMPSFLRYGLGEQVISEKQLPFTWHSLIQKPQNLQNFQTQFKSYLIKKYQLKCDPSEITILKISKGSIRVYYTIDAKSGCFKLKLHPYFKAFNLCPKDFDIQENINFSNAKPFKSMLGKFPNFQPVFGKRYGYKKRFNHNQESQKYSLAFIGVTGTQYFGHGSQDPQGQQKTVDGIPGGFALKQVTGQISKNKMQIIPQGVYSSPHLEIKLKLAKQTYISKKKCHYRIFFQNKFNPNCVHITQQDTIWVIQQCGMMPFGIILVNTQRQKQKDNKYFLQLSKNIADLNVIKRLIQNKYGVFQFKNYYKYILQGSDRKEQIIKSIQARQAIVPPKI